MVELNLKQNLSGTRKEKFYSKNSQSALFAVPVPVNVGLRLESLHQIGLFQQTIFPVLEQKSNLFDLLLIVMFVG